MTPLKIRNSTLKLYVLNGILLVTSVFAFCPPPKKKSLMTENDHDRNLWGLKMIMTLNDFDPS